MRPTTKAREIRARAWHSDFGIRGIALPDGMFRLLEPLWYPVGDEWNVVPPGTLTDFASIPRFLWPVFPPTGSYWKAAIVHDWLCIVAKAAKTEAEYRSMAKHADMVFLDLMTRSGVRWITRQILFSSVRVAHMAKKWEAPK